MDIIKLQETCESCKHPHTFSRNKREGDCDWLHVQTGQEAVISRSTRCKNYLRDTEKWNEMNK